MCLSVAMKAGASSQSVEITFELFDHPDDVKAVCGARAEKLKNVRGCATLYDDGKRCSIVARRPKDWDDERALQTLGHEVMHCLWWTHGRK